MTFSTADSHLSCPNTQQVNYCSVNDIFVSQMLVLIVCNVEIYRFLSYLVEMQAYISSLFYFLLIFYSFNSPGSYSMVSLGSEEVKLSCKISICL